MKLFARRALALLVWSPLLLTVACGNQLEGDRCDTFNGNSDCESGLVCSQRYLGGYYFVCCPPAGTAATASVCNAGGGPPADGGASDAQTNVDGGADAAAPD